MKFMHLADVHLGAVPDAGMSWSRERANDIWNTFRDTIADARREKVDLLLIAGDLFHRPPGREELREVEYLFSTIEKTRVVLIAGNHDCLSPGCVYGSYSFGSNVAGLFSEECECVRFPEIHTEVYGFSYWSQEITEPLYDDLQPVDNDYFHILLAHGGDARHIPLSREKLAGSDFDYIALGHIHKGQVLVPDKAVFPGALEPIDCLDEGPHGYMLGEVHGCEVTVNFVPKAKCEYRTVRIECTQEDTSYSVADALQREMERQGWQHIYKVVLTGTHAVGTTYDLSRLTEYGRVYSVTDETAAAYQTDRLRETCRGSLIGRYIDSFEKAHMSAVEEKALAYGLEALLAAREEDR